MVDQLFEQREKLTSGQGILVAIAAIAVMFDFFDFNILGFIISFVSKPWNLSVGEATIIIGTSGVGVILGGFIWGKISDMIGRRIVFIVSVLIYSLGSALMAVTPYGSWQFLSILRIFVGFGVAGAFTTAFPLVSEFLPAKRRGFYNGLVATFVPIGTLIASTISTYLEPVIGWRGLALFSGIPAIVVLTLYFYVPESPRWLLTKGRDEDARKTMAKVLKMSPDAIDLEGLKKTRKVKKLKWRDIAKYKRSLISSWLVNLGTQGGSYTFTLWGPALLVVILGITAHQAAYLFIFVSLAGFFGRIVFDVLIDIIGRKMSGYIVSVLAIIIILIQAFYHSVLIGGVSVFYIGAIIGYFFINGLWPIVTNLGTEEWPQELRASGWGSSYGFGGLGKVIAPVGLGLIIGAGFVLKPHPSLGSIVPAYIFMAFIMVIGLVGFLIAHETSGKSLESIEDSLEATKS